MHKNIKNNVKFYNRPKCENTALSCTTLDGFLTMFQNSENLMIKFHEKVRTDRGRNGQTDPFYEALLVSTGGLNILVYYKLAPQVI